MSEEEKNQTPVEESMEQKQNEEQVETGQSMETANETDAGNLDSSAEQDANDEIQRLTEELNKVEDKYLRLQAELANIRRRHQKEREGDRLFRAQSLATDLLPVIDNLERALTIQVEDEQGANLKKGIEMVMDSFQEALKREGIEVLDPLNEPFDPQYEEAYNTVPAEEGQESGVVAQVYEKGYRLNGRILRAAKVAVTE